MADKLVVVEGDREHRYRFYIQWELGGDDHDMGGYLCQSENDGLGEAPKDPEEWQHWAASKAIRGTEGFAQDSMGAYWEEERLARSALRVAKAALKQERPMPEWAVTALENGWKPPKGWKA